MFNLLIITNWEPDRKKIEALKKFTFPNWLWLISKVASQKGVLDWLKADLLQQGKQQKLLQ
jgi:hypothetical protein